ncbi:hypothetical protein AB0M48_08385 [Lentzea sp. NPDC051208]|uniref:hypothetical protein n=1 Tax=Lentzea sp. NPDC051208 TaxID=3154642 RepID=UPI00342746D3
MTSKITLGQSDSPRLVPLWDNEVFAVPALILPSPPLLSVKSGTDGPGIAAPNVCE